MSCMSVASSMQYRDPFEEVDRSNYEMSDTEYAAIEAEATWVDSLLNMLAAILQWLQPLLTAGNHDRLISLLMEKVGPRGRESKD